MLFTLTLLALTVMVMAPICYAAQNPQWRPLWLSEPRTREQAAAAIKAAATTTVVALAAAIAQPFLAPHLSNEWEVGYLAGTIAVLIGLTVFASWSDGKYRRVDRRVLNWATLWVGIGFAATINTHTAPVSVITLILFATWARLATVAIPIPGTSWYIPKIWGPSDARAFTLALLPICTLGGTLIPILAYLLVTALAAQIWQVIAKHKGWPHTRIPLVPIITGTAAAVLTPLTLLLAV